MFHVKHFDVIVIGAGHAGTEAALAAARRGAMVALVSFREADLGVMSCNPAIGGIGKGHLVREIDAMDGLMGVAGDYSGIQYRLLNRSRGPAVWGPRVQSDRSRYSAFVSRVVKADPRVQLVIGEATDIVIEGTKVGGVVLGDGTRLVSPSVIVTSGTFLRGRIHIGNQVETGGRVDADPADRLGRRIEEIIGQRGRLKTGTPARLRSSTIDWDRLERQDGDTDPVMLSFMNKRPVARQIACGVTATNERTHEIINANLHLSAMRQGNIEGVGPRYCPSIEDKTTRFADKSSHNIFLEPEGLDSDLVYPNGISTSLPADVQDAFIRTITGLESVEIARYGYAIEYDFFDPRALLKTLAVKGIEGLFLAGQINGTTGYEEAAAQGLVAGINAAALSVGGESWTPDRTESYIGVMIDDLVTRGVNEPYRMFTSRAEMRLTLRPDNADQRLTPIATRLGVVSGKRQKAFAEKMEKLERAIGSLQSTRVSKEDFEEFGRPLPKAGVSGSLHDFLRLELDFEAVRNSQNPALRVLDADTQSQVVIEAFYRPYVERQTREVQQLRTMDDVAIPHGLDYSRFASLSAELQQKLSQAQPTTMAEAGRLEGMTPAAMLVLRAHIGLLRKSA
ncbi:MAG: tRNA uridine-5-carboxymethylaminomethyl(34) synthesis enzyme MnmG [Paracoccaceae bacterium]